MVLHSDNRRHFIRSCHEMYFKPVFWNAVTPLLLQLTHQLKMLLVSEQFNASSKRISFQSNTKYAETCQISAKYHPRDGFSSSNTSDMEQQ